MNQRQAVIALYRQLYHLGKDYPRGKDWFHPRLKAAFLKHKNETDPEKIEALINRAEFVVKEIEALYTLRKYRAMKSRYYDDKK
ncbi:hypothetical protein RB195_013545 [Necator americanus]|nr:complex 1 protein [Necator americanus]ETN79161.1 complex 1 protein [Necator americanus]